MPIKKVTSSALLALCVLVACGDTCGVPPTPGTPSGVSL